MAEKASRPMYQVFLDSDDEGLVKVAQDFLFKFSDFVGGGPGELDRYKKALTGDPKENELVLEAALALPENGWRNLQKAAQQKQKEAKSGKRK